MDTNKVKNTDKVATIGVDSKDVTKLKRKAEKVLSFDTVEDMRKFTKRNKFHHIFYVNTSNIVKDVEDVIAFGNDRLYDKGTVTVVHDHPTEIETVEEVIEDPEIVVNTADGRYNRRYARFIQKKWRVDGELPKGFKVEKKTVKTTQPVENNTLKVMSKYAHKNVGELTYVYTFNDDKDIVDELS